MAFEGTQSLMTWITYSIFFVSGAILFGGIVAIAAVKQLRKITADREDGWQFTDVQSILAFIIVFAFIGVVCAFIFKPPTVDAGAKDTLILLVGALVAKFGDVCAYFFNSSIQSRGKDETARIAAAAADTTAKTMAAVVSGTGTGITDRATVTNATAVETTKPPEHAGDPVVKETTTEAVTTPIKGDKT